MTADLRPAQIGRLFTLSWIMAQAFTKHQPGAIMAYPVCLLTIGIYLPRRQVYETPDSTGMVIFGRFQIRHELSAAALLVGAFLLGILLAGNTIGPLGISLATLLWSPFALGLVQLNPGALSMTPAGPETPPGDWWQIAALAQRPDTSTSALLLTRRLLSTLPPGAVAVAAAADDRLLHAYERLGFTRGKAKRVYLITPHAL